MVNAMPLRRVAIIPAYNEDPVIGVMLRRLPPGLFDEVIVADNGSRDRTSEEAAKAGATVVRCEERGYGAACLQAVEYLDKQDAVVVFLQADASEDATEAAYLMQPVLDGEADLVIGSRVSERAEVGSLLPHQQFGNWLATGLIRLLYGHTYSDLGPFRAIRLDALHRLRMRDRNYGWTVEMQVRALEEGLRILEIPVSYRKRAGGENKVSGNLNASLRAGRIILSTVLRLWWTRSSRTAAGHQNR